ncbi:indolepyruvate ferredoxin oxidoreductase family protein [Streptomyces sp. NPDC002680]|uniref:indolepyruvate ferredoxin oxidoreductase family protein n=1 Tax=Streptomyces sp. NPDC002680 TaxID=3364659 RepID=UPI00367BAC52
MSSATPVRSRITLDDKYTATSGSVLLTGIQALVRTALDQRRLDALRGHDTAVFVSGYQGSPLGGVDREMKRADAFLRPEDVVFRQGLNEELAATAVAGTQLLGELENRTKEGVTGIWFGKNPGLDRAADAIRHGNISGTAPLGGAVAWIGDDPTSKSSTVPSSCEPMCRSLVMPLLTPGSVAEILTFGLHAIAMSRHAGLWTGLKIVADVADASAVVSVDGLLEQIPDLGRPRSFRPPVLLPPTNLDAEFDLMTGRLARAQEYAEAANLNRVTHEPARARIAIMAAGLGHQSVLRALHDLGIDDAGLDHLGIRLVRLGMPWPLDHRLVRRMLRGVETVFVVEDKLPFLEGLVKEALFGTGHAPEVVGKLRGDGSPLLSPRGGLVSDDVVAALLKVVPGIREVAVVPAPRSRTRHLDLLPARTPAFCSGCPHSVSTRADTDQLVGVGIGCHVMVALEDPGESGTDKRGRLTGMTQMGGEGAQWLGLEPFTADRHFFQNVGDGTYYHSASLAVRAAVAAGSTITYKLLFNDAVAMTGGQTPAGQMSIPSLTKALLLEGVRKIVVTTAHPEAWRRTRFGRSVSVRHRDHLAEVQRELADEAGVTVLLHIDRCATEERRLRRRGKLPAPAERVWINERVCEGCGDCGEKSTCLSVLPVESEFGRKTRIHQSSCNQDASCLHGDCPSFVKVRPSGRPVTRTVPDITLPEPRRRVPADVLVRMPGIGGTGVVTASAVLQMAAFIQGDCSAGLEQIGLAQKGGPVISDVRFSTRPVTGQLRAGRGTVDVLLGFDALGAAGEATLDSLRGTAVAVVNTAHVPTSVMVHDTAATAPAWQDVRARIDAATTASDNLYVDAGDLADRYFADHMSANMILVGAAFQHGVLPLEAWAVEEAVRLNGAAVDTNLSAFRLGRIAAAAPELLRPTATAPTPTVPEIPVPVSGLPEDVRRRVSRLAGELVAYQNDAYAQEFVDSVGAVADRAEDAEDVVAAYAEGLFKLMAYKDEYEVARLHLDSVGKARLASEFGPGAKARIMLQPPLLRALGLRRKIGLGPWAFPALRLLYATRWMRGTKIDLFGRAEVRRVERSLPAEYRNAMELALPSLAPSTRPLVLDLAQAPEMVRGYEDVKLRNVERFRLHVAQLLTELRGTDAPAATVHP